MTDPNADPSATPSAGTSPPAPFAALILAADRGAADPVAQARGVPAKCLAPIAGRPMLDWVVDALEASGRIGDMAVSLRDCNALAADPALAARAAAGRLRPLACAATPSLSVLEGLAALAPDGGPMLVTTGDHPLLTPAMVGFFCDRALASGADLLVGLAGAGDIRAGLAARGIPMPRRTWLRFRDERYSGCNLFAVMTPRGLEAVRFWRRVEAERKRPWRIMRAFGTGSLLLYLTGRLTLAQAFARASAGLELRAEAVVLPFAEAAIDVDSPADFALAERLLRARAPGPAPARGGEVRS